MKLRWKVLFLSLTVLFLWSLAPKAMANGDPGYYPFGTPGEEGIKAADINLVPINDSDNDTNPDWGDLQTGDEFCLIVPEGLCFDGNHSPVATVTAESPDFKFQDTNGYPVVTMEATLIDANNDGCYEKVCWTLADDTPEGGADSSPIHVANIYLSIQNDLVVPNGGLEIKPYWMLGINEGTYDQEILHVFTADAIGTEVTVQEDFLPQITRGAEGKVATIQISEKTGYEFDYDDQFEITFPEGITVVTCTDTNTNGVECAVDEIDPKRVNCTLKTETNDPNNKDAVSIQCEIRVSQNYSQNNVSVSLSDDTADDDGDEDLTRITPVDIIEVAEVVDAGITVIGPDPVPKAPIGGQGQFTINITEMAYGSLNSDINVDLPAELSATDADATINSGNCNISCAPDESDASLVVCEVSASSTQGNKCNVNITITAQVAGDAEEGLLSATVSTTLVDNTPYAANIDILEAVIGATATVEERGNVDTLSPLMQLLGKIKITENVAGTLQPGKYFSILTHGVTDAAIDLNNAIGIASWEKYYVGEDSVLLEVKLKNPLDPNNDLPIEVPIMGIAADDGIIKADVLNGNVFGEEGCGVMEAKGLYLALTDCPKGEEDFSGCSTQEECELGGGAWWNNACHKPITWDVQCGAENGIAFFKVKVTDCGELCGQRVRVKVAATDPIQWQTIDYSWLLGQGWVPGDYYFEIELNQMADFYDFLEGYNISVDNLMGWYAGVVIDINENGIFEYNELELQYCQFKEE